VHDPVCDGICAPLGLLERRELLRTVAGQDEMELEARRAGVDDEDVQ
jgi:DNA primase catalytic subunit